MAKFAQDAGAPAPFRSFDPVKFGGSSRLTFKRLRRPTPLPVIGSIQGLGNCIQRLGALLRGR